MEDEVTRMLRYNTDHNGRHIDLFLKNVRVEPHTTYRLTFDLLGGAIGCWSNHCFTVGARTPHYFERCDRWTPCEVRFTTSGNIEKQAAFENWGLSFFKKMDSRLITGIEDSYIDNVRLVKEDEPSVDLLCGGDFEAPREDAVYEKNWYPMFVGPIGEEFGIDIVTDPLHKNNRCLRFPKIVSSIAYPASIALRAVAFGVMRAPLPVAVTQIDPLGANEHWLLLAQRGRIRLTVNEESITVGAGGGVFVPRGVPAEWTLVNTEEAVYYWVAFEGDEINALLQETQIASPRTFSVPDLTPLTECIDNMLSFPTGNRFYPYAVEGYLQVLLAQLSKLSAERGPSERELIITQAALRLREHPELPLSNEELADSCGFSTAHFVRLFRQYTGCTPHRYRLDALVQKACSLLCETSLSIKEIAFTLGVDNPLYFSNLFRKSLGVSPREYREKNKRHLV